VSVAGRASAGTGGTLILGAGGMLGTSWQAVLRGVASPGEWKALSRVECDIRDEGALRREVKRGAVVVNCAAYTAVDKAETDEAEATAVNGGAVASVARVCRDAGATLVHYSTDYVFDGAPPEEAGKKSAGYPVNWPRRPINAYGRSKHAGELALEALALDGWTDWLCVRASWLYDAHGKNFVLTIAKAAGERPVLRVVDDQRGRPTWCEQLARTTRALVVAGKRGMWHAADGGDCTWFGFASEIVRHVNDRRRAAGASESELCRVEPCTTAEFPRPARRPAYSVLGIGETERVAGRIPDWRASLSEVMGRVAAG
jgi:dTDP-4-dehydrorhamnose reductase